MYPHHLGRINNSTLLLAFAVWKPKTNTHLNTVQEPLNLTVISTLSTLPDAFKDKLSIAVLTEGYKGNPHVFGRSFRPLTTLAILKPCAASKRMTCT